MNPDKTAIEKLWERHHFVTEGLRQELMTKKSFLAALSEAEGERWISVGDELPEFYQPVIVHGGVAELRVDGWWTFMECPKRMIQWDVTHWQPLPAPPKEKP